MSIRLCIINRNYPPNKGATGYYASRLVGFLKKDNRFKISIVTVGSRDDTNEIKYVRGSYSGKVKWRRLFSTYFEGRKLIKRALTIDADVYIVMTDPPFLNYWASKLLRDKKWILWSMDLFPAAFAANNLIDPKHVLYKHYESSLKTSPPSFIISLGDEQLEHLKQLYYPRVMGLSLPIGIREEGERSKGLSKEVNTNTKIVLGYAGSIGEAHDAEVIIRIVKNLNPDHYSFLLSCKGSKSTYVASQLSDLEYVTIKDELSEKELGEIDIHVVSLIDKWTHICVPSKALSALQKSRPVLFIGSENSDTWQLINGAGWRLSEDYDILEFLSELTLQEVTLKKNRAKDVSLALMVEYENGLIRIKQKIEQLKSDA